MKLIDFRAFNAYATGTSFISAEQKKTSITLTSINDVANYITELLNGFYSEKTGNWSRWTFISKLDLNWICCSESLDYNENLVTLNEIFGENGSNSFSFSGGTGAPKYKINGKRVGDNFLIEVTTYVHITLSSDLFAWFTEDMMKEALIKKIEHINSNNCL
jgi:hypothetical protein